MNLFQTSPVVMSIIDYKIQKDITNTKESGAESRNDATNITGIIKEAMHDFGAPLGGFLIGRLSNKKDKDDRNDSNKRNPSSKSDVKVNVSLYDQKSKEWDKAIEQVNNNKPVDFPVIQKSMQEKLSDQVESLYRFGNPFEISNGLKLGVGSSILPLPISSLFML